MPPSETQETEARWLVACTLPRHEKVVAYDLGYKQVHAYLPLYRALRRWNGRRAEVDLPLFPGYVFVRIPFCERLKVLEHPSVLRFVMFRGRPAQLPDDEFERLQLSLATRHAEPYPFLAAGKQIRIKRGPLSGLAGKIIRRKGRMRLVVSIDFIQRAVIFELDAADVQLGGA